MREKPNPILTLSYLNGDAARSAQMSVNGGASANLSFPNTGGWGTVGTLQAAVQLNAGSNTIKLSNATGWAPDFDRIQLVGSGGGTALLLDNFDSSPAWLGANDLGKWSSANSFVNQAGVIENGALKLQYNNNGWFGSDVTQSLTGYSKLIMRIKGAAGGEEGQFHLVLGGEEKTFGAFSGNTVTTTYKDIAIDLAASGVDRSSPGQLQMSFWHGSAGTVWIDEIRFE